jgi:hypothetical protein
MTQQDIDFNIEHKPTDGFIEKPKLTTTTALSNVKGSEIANAISPKLSAINLFSTNRYYTLSENIAPTRHKSLPEIDKPENYLPSTSNNFLTKDLDLEKYLSNIPKHQQNQFIEQWLVAVSLGVLDYWAGNNFPYFYHDTDPYFSKAFDLELCMYIATPSDIEKFYAQQLKVSYAEHEKGLHAQQAKFLRKAFSLLTKDFFDKLLAVPLETICDFSKIRHFQYDDALSTRAEKGYKARFKMLADQYTKSSD